MVNKSAPFN